MSREIPEVVRAAAGLTATLLDEARKLPRTLPALPVRAIGLAMQTTLRLQQEYSGLVVRGDEVLTGLRGDREPGLATFDEELPAAAGPLGSRTSSFDRVGTDPVDTFDEDLGHIEDDPEDDPEDATTATEEIFAEGLTGELGGADLTDDDVAGLPEDPIADEITATVDELAVNMSEDAAQDDAVIAASEQAIAAVLEHADPPADPAAPIEGYDAFTVAQLRGRLRGYQPVTVDELIAYEQATRARQPFLTLLRNRQEKLAREQG